MAIKGPKGIGFFLSKIPQVIPMIPRTAPRILAKKKEISMNFGPITKPITVNNLISPPPIPPFDRIAISNNRRNAMAAPRSEFHHGCKG